MTPLCAKEKGVDRRLSSCGCIGDSGVVTDETALRETSWGAVLRTGKDVQLGPMIVDVGDLRTCRERVFGFGAIVLSGLTEA